MIEARELRKAYGELAAVDGVSFRAEAGEIFGLLGPNGAGKTTTIGCLSGLLAPSGGVATILGHDVAREPEAAKQYLGLVPQELALYEEISAAENLRCWGAAYRLGGRELERRVFEVLEIVGLLDRAREPVRRFSGGMKRRLNFGCGIVHRPKALLLDEPTVGVDPTRRLRCAHIGP
jgi:ABC-2 type transport system ATP-binding protein